MIPVASHHMYAQHPPAAPQQHVPHRTQPQPRQPVYVGETTTTTAARSEYLALNGSSPASATVNALASHGGRVAGGPTHGSHQQGGNVVHVLKLEPMFTEQTPSAVYARSTDTSATILGRNVVTRIRDLCLSRSLCEVSINEPGRSFVRMRKRASEHSVHLNGRKLDLPIGAVREVFNGSVLSLYNNRYQYAISIHRNAERTSPPPPPTRPIGGHVAAPSIPRARAVVPVLRSTVGPPPPPGDGKEDENDAGNDAEKSGEVTTEELRTAAESARQSIVEELTCSVCMDIIVNAAVCNPCGHVFCGQCLEDVRQSNSDCPNCRGKIRSTTRTRQIDNIIMGAVLRGEFPLDDCKFFLNRAEKKLSPREMLLLERQCKRNHEEPFGDDAAPAEEDTSSSSSKRRLSDPSATDAAEDHDRKRLRYTEGAPTPNMKMLPTTTTTTTTVTNGVHAHSVVHAPHPQRPHQLSSLVINNRIFHPPTRGRTMDDAIVLD